MRFARWQAQGNVYLVAEEPLTPDRVRAEVGDADGILEVKGRGRDWVEIAIWNPDGSLAEMSGNGTRIAARWLAETTGAEIVTVRVGPREVLARMLAPPFVEQRLAYSVGEPGAAAGAGAPRAPPSGRGPCRQPRSASAPRRGSRRSPHAQGRRTRRRSPRGRAARSPRAAPARSTDW